MNIYIILKEDIVTYPPILSLIRIMQEQGHSVTHLGTYSDPSGRADLERAGARFVEMPRYDIKGNPAAKILQQLKFRSAVTRWLAANGVTRDDLVWIPLIKNIYLLHKLTRRYRVVLNPLEFNDDVVKRKFRMLSPGIDIHRTFGEAEKVVCCEYNRAHITKGIFNLDKLPYVLPNKPYINEEALSSVPADVAAGLEDYFDRIRGKKVILYQGIFLDKERRLEEFCQCVGSLPDDFVFVAMGSGTEMFERMRQKYEGERVIFLPFQKPPYHLLVTRSAYIGVLTYFPRQENIVTVINPLYCAPNKIYEYSKFGKPMIANDIPGLHYIFKDFDCGKCVSYPMTPAKIAANVLELDAHYSRYSEGARKFYESEDIPAIVADILKD